MKTKLMHSLFHRHWFSHWSILLIKRPVDNNFKGSGKRSLLFYFYPMKDNFSRQAVAYAKYRPAYPKELYDFILGHIKMKNAAWDCGTGNGQTANALARYFEKVFATDISENQIQNAHKAENIYYSVQPAEQTGFENNKFDLVTVSQALHWFDINKFYSEVKRVTQPGGWIAIWTYSLLSISPKIDPLINQKLYKEILGTYWDAERKWVDERYATLPFPFREIECPVFHMTFEWTIDALCGYLTTWSAVQKFIAANRINPVDELMEEIKPHWTQKKMRITFPLYIRMGQIEK
jgi:ubiquinone/menaquinone biosynthesis C-methylase UbiE